MMMGIVERCSYERICMSVKCLKPSIPLLEDQSYVFHLQDDKNFSTYATGEALGGVSIGALKG